ncbi:SDR family NAD(P)-dependent oxidoreductase [Bradyrhizobium barranii]|uniref:SDR family NAD(P)-dependent oxidoreductase n=1 Tax=Bradyrhizobium barranii TaxID=2992140 RepID=UPI0021119E9E|nr:SDR family NAD(P)-dependent oxidoreductase [Bradyrhizobium barranii]
MAAVYSDLAGKVVLVTGGASGIGAAIVRRFAQQKSNVVFFDIKADEGPRTRAVGSGSGCAFPARRPD